MPRLSTVALYTVVCDECGFEDTIEADSEDEALAMLEDDGWVELEQIGERAFIGACDMFDDYYEESVAWDIEEQEGQA